ncbi:MAG: hypothetical protein O9353_13100, partial [Bacteroidia bacterium]|nr:hypothetical protein [Bacteroidia bacterium]
MFREFTLDMRADVEIFEGILFFVLISAVLAYSPELIGKVAMRGIEIQDVTLLRKIDRGIDGLDILLPLGKDADHLHRRNARE